MRLQKPGRRASHWLSSDTAGRLAIDEQMMVESEAIKRNVKPTETLFVIDSMTGQDAWKQQGF